MSVTTPKSKPKPKPKRRSIGRPVDDRVGEERILAVTVDLLKTTKPSQLNRLEIARAAGVDPGLIRYYFGTKDRLLSHAVIAITETIVGDASVHLASTGSARVRFERYVRAFFAAVTVNPNYHELLLQQIFAGTTKRSRELRVELRAVGQIALRSMIDQGIAEGVFRDVDTRLLEISLLGLCHYIVISWPLFEDVFAAEGTVESTMGKYLTFITDMLFAHIATREPSMPVVRERAATPTRKALARQG